MFASEFVDGFANAVARKVIEQMTSVPVGQQRLFTIEQAATYLGRSAKAVEHLIARGVIPCTRLDGKRQIDRASLDKVIADRTYYET